MPQELYKNYFKVLSSVEIQNKLFVNENVGIGTLDPTEKLDVSGSAKITGDLNVNSNVQILSSLTVKDNVTVLGKLSALGESYFANTVFSTTSAICAYNTGPGPALYVYQAAGPYDVASFVDGDGVEVLHVGNASTPSGGGKIGINNGDPNKELSVRGSVSATEMAYFDGNVLIGIEGQRISNLTVTGDISSANGLFVGGNLIQKDLQSVYSTVQSYSGQSWNQNLTFDENTDVITIRDSNNISLSSITKNNKNYTHANFLPLSGGVVIGDLTITGNVSSLGILTYIDSQVSITSSIEITNTGTGPALKVTQTGSQDIASFYDDTNSALIIKDGGDVGIGTLNPNKKLTVIGEISSTGSVYIDGNLIQPEFVDLKSKVNSLSSNWDSVYTSVNNTSGNWDKVYTSVNNVSGNWNDVYTSVNVTSGNWNDVYTSVNNVSGNWDKVYTSVNATSGNWNDVYTSVNNVSGNWNNVYSSVNNVSGNWDKVYTSVNNTSGNWNDVYTSVNLTSGNWNNVYSSVNNVSGNWNDVYTSVNVTSGNWNNVYTSVNNTSANWDKVYTTVNTTSANWDNIYTSINNVSSNWDKVYTSVNASSADWNKVYTFVNNNSSLDAEVTSFVVGNSSNIRDANSIVFNLHHEWDETRVSVNTLSGNWDSVYTSVNATSGKWDSVYTNVFTNSASYVTVSNLDNKFLPLSGGNITGTLSSTANIHSKEFVYNSTERPDLTGVKQALDVLLYTTPLINSLTVSGGNSLEVGQSLTTPTITWVSNKTLNSFVLTLPAGSQTSGSSTFLSYSDPNTYTVTSQTSSRTWNVVGTDWKAATASRSTTVSWLYKIYAGGISTISPNSSDILTAGTTNALGSTRTTLGSRSYTLNDQYWFVAYPSSLGVTSSLKVNGLSFTDLASVYTINPFTNASGGTASYYVYRTNNKLTGTYTMEVV